MSTTIPEALDSLRTKIAAVYTACASKGAPLPATQNAENLAQAIRAIPDERITDKTVFDFGNGDLSSFSWSGEIDSQTMVDTGLLNKTSVPWQWSKMPTKVVVGNTVTSLGFGAFGACSGLRRVVLPSSVTSIGQGAFDYCTNLSSVVIPNDVTTIGAGAFGSCSNLSSISIPDKVTYIDEETFIDCTRLANVSLGSSIERIAMLAFLNCNSLKSIVIPASVTQIEEDSFIDASNLMYVVIPDKTESQVGSMNYLLWNLPAGCKICCSDGIITVE